MEQRSFPWMALAGHLKSTVGSRMLGVLALGLMPLMASATVTVVNKFEPDTIYVGDTSTYTLRVKNSSNVGLTDVALTSLLGNDVRVLGIDSDTCNFSSKTVQSTAPYGVILSGGTTLPQVGTVAGECLVTLKVTSNKSGNHPANIPANTSPTATQSGFSAKENGVLVQNSTLTNVTLGVNSLPAPSGYKEFPSGGAYEGAPFPLTITLYNNSDKRDLPLTSFTDNLPAGMTVASPANAQLLSCPGTPAITADPGTAAVTLTGGTIPVSGSCKFSVDVVVSTLAGGTAKSYTNTIPSGAIGNTRGLNSSGFNNSVTVNPALNLSKQFLNANGGAISVVPVGVPVKMRITITNNGVVALTNAGLLDNLPAPMKLAATPNATVTCSAGGSGGTLSGVAPNSSVIEMTGATIPARTNASTPGTCTIEADVVMTAESDGGATNTVGDTANKFTSDQNVSSRPVSATLKAYDQLQVEKNAAPTEVAPGQWTQFTIVIKNYSASAVTGTSVQDALQGGLVLDTSAAPTSTCASMVFTPNGSTNTDGGTLLQGTGGTIPAASGINPGQCTVTFRARLPAGASGAYVNTLPVGSVGNGTTGNTNTVSRSVTTVDSVVINKRFTGSTTEGGLAAVAQGQSATLLLTITNRFNSTLGNVTLVDSLPTGLTLAADPQPVNNCGGTLEARPYDTTIRLTGGSVNPRPATNKETSCTIEVKVTGNVLGTYTNTIDGAQTSQFSNDKSAPAKPTSDKLVIIAGLSAKKAFNPAVVAEGAVSRATVSISNTTSGQLTNVTMVDDGLVNMTVANPANASTTCSGTASVTANPGSTEVRLAGAVIPAWSTCEVSFDVQASNDTAPSSNTIGAGKITSTEGAFNSVPVSATLTKQTKQLSLNKSFSETFVQGNVPTVLKLTVSNNSDVDMKGISFTDPFPTGLQVYSVPNISTTCSGATVAAVPGGDKVVVTGVNVPRGNFCVVQVTVTSNQYLNLTNTIPSGSINSEGGYTNQDPAIATVSTLEGLGVAKGFTPETIQAGGISRLKITLVNTFAPTSTPLTGVSFTDNLPSGLEVASNANATTTCVAPNNGSVVTVSVSADRKSITLANATLSPSQSCALELDVTAGATGSYTNEIPKGSVTTYERVTNDVPGKSTLVVDEGPDVLKNFNPRTVSVGQKSRLSVTITNKASIDMTGVSFADNLPSGMVVANPINGGSSCTGGVVNANPGDVRVTFTGATVNKGASCEFWVDVISTKTGQLENTIAKDAIKSNQGLTNGNPTTSTLTVLTPPEVSKSFTPVKIAAGGTSQLVINLTNKNSSPITLTQLFADALPANVFVQTPANINLAPKPAAALFGACDNSKVAVATGNTRVTYAKDAVIPAGGCSIWVDVTSSVKGSYLNKIEPGQLQTDAGFNTSPAVATIGVDGMDAAPTIKKSFSKKVINPNQPTVLTIEMINPNDHDLVLTDDLVDTFPAGMVIANPTGVVAGAAGCQGAFSVAPGDTSVTFPTGAILPKNGGCSITMNVTANAAGTYPNTIGKDALKTDGGNNPEETTDGITVVPPTDPTVLKEFDPKSIARGQTSRLKITLTNGSDQVATLTEDLVDELPAGMELSLTPNVGGTCLNYGSVEAQIGWGGGGMVYTFNYLKDSKLPAKGSCTMEVDVTTTSNPGTVLTNTIDKGALVTDKGTNQVPTSDKITVLTDPPPSVSKNFSPNQIAPGGASTLMIQLGNPANVDSTLTSNLVDTLPGDLTVLDNSMTAGSTCDIAHIEAIPGSKTVTYKSGGVIPKQGTCYILVAVTGTTPGKVTNTIAIGQVVTTTGTNPGPGTADITILPAGSLAAIAGHVYHDRDDNGLIATIGEEGVGGVTVVLKKVGASGLVTVATTTTLPDGSYSFTGLPPGSNYIVTVQHPTGWINGKDTPGDKGGSVFVSDEISGVTLNPGDNGVNYNFGLRKPATLSGTVYHDRDNNGVIVPGTEEGVPGTEIMISYKDPTDPSKTVTRTTTTDSSGNYTFTDLPPDTEYTVTKVKHPSGWNDGKDTAGDKGGVANQDDVLAKVTLKSGDEAKEYNFGLLKPNTLAGKVYHDRSDDGKIDAKEEGVPGAEVKITWTDKNGVPQSKTTTTGPDGSYSFTDLPTFTEFTVTKVKHPTGWIDGKDTAGDKGGEALQNDVLGKVSLTSGEDAKEYNFGLLKTPSLSGKVYFDRDDDGDLNNKDTGVADVEVKLTWKDSGGVEQSRTTKTASDGSYSFPDLTPGVEYTVTKIHPKGWEDRKDNVGSKGGTANQDDVISVIKLGSAESATDYNFGLYREETSPTAVPTMSEMGLAMLSLMLMGFAALRQRKTLNKRQ